MDVGISVYRVHLGRFIFLGPILLLLGSSLFCFVRFGARFLITFLLFFLVLDIFFPSFHDFNTKHTYIRTRIIHLAERLVL